MDALKGALDGIRVITCSTAVAGTVPYMFMADLGAEVIKIEVPNGGDNSRKAGVIKGEDVSSFFETNNRGVKSITLNLKEPDAKTILHKLVKTADIFGQNFRPGAAERYGRVLSDPTKRAFSTSHSSSSSEEEAMAKLTNRRSVKQYYTVGNEKQVLCIHAHII